ncbi:MAG: hypothetical protein K2M04_06325 [Muribaculaceae bacterium]|nr:hypothetical protein [Muribaculaceae bacterium]
MKNFLYSIFVSMALPLMTTGCNSDIFGKVDSLPDISVVNIEGDGGYEKLIYNPDGLRKISVSCMPYEEKDLVYSGYSGSVIPADSPADEVAYIHFGTVRQEFSIDFDGNVIYIISDYSNYEGISARTITLSYDDCEKIISINFLPGQSLDFRWLSYNDGVEVTEDRKEVSTTTLTNDTDEETTVYINPAEGTFCTARITPENPLLNGIEIFDASVPILFDDEWALTSVGEYTLGKEVTYEPWGHGTRFVKVAPHSSKKVTLTVTYSNVEMTGEIIFHNMVTNQEVKDGITCVVNYPTDYEIEIE